MTFHPPKPQTLARRQRNRLAEQEISRSENRNRLATLAKRDGPDSIFAELHQEAVARDAAAKPTGATN